MAARSHREKEHTKNKNQVILAEMLKEDSNKYCSDCGAKGPRWASWNLGVFLCIRCAGIHRNLGVHISKVKSVNLDSWTPEQMTNIQEWGNRRAGMYWECFLPQDFLRPQTNSAVETFIRNKYEHKKYVKKDGLPPKSDLNVAASSNISKPEKVTKKKKLIEEKNSITIPKPQDTITKTTATTAAVSRPKAAQPQQSVPAPSAPVKANPPSVDLLSLDSPDPVVNQQPPKPQSTSQSLANELIDFGAFQSGPQGVSQSPVPQQPQQLASLSQATSPVDNEESLLKDDTTSSKSTKDSIMALFSSSTTSTSQQPQMYGVPGGVYITPQQQQPTMQQQSLNMMNGPQQSTMQSMQKMPHGMMNGPQQPPMPNMSHAMMNGQQQSIMQKMPHGMMNAGPYHQQHMMPMNMQQQRLMQHATPQQQQAQLSQIQSQMQQLKLQKAPQGQFQQMQQPNQLNSFNSNQTMFGQQQAMNLMTNQHMMNCQQQQPQFVSTGPVYHASPMGAMPSTGHTLNNQLWK